jgi:hypothetical protein
MMRAIVWGSVAVAVCCSAAFVMAARLAAEYPDSMLARCANMAGYVASRCNPLVSWVHQPAKPKAVQARIQVDQIEAPQEAVIIEEMVEEFVPEAVEPIVVENAIEIVDEGTVIVGGRILGAIAGQVAGGAPIGAGAGALIGSAVAEESDEPPQQATTPEETGIPRMPYADEDEETSAVDGCGSVEWQEMIRWFWGCDARCSGNTVPHCHFQMTLEKMIECIKAAEDETTSTTVDEETQEDARVNEENQDETGDNSETNPPQCEEDRHYHHHYPSCPYTGRCAYPPHYQRVVPYDMQRVTTPPETQDAPKPEPEEQTSDTPRKKKKCFRSNYSPVHPEIDTLECRPSDGPEDYDLDEPF